MRLVRRTFPLLSQPGLEVTLISPLLCENTTSDPTDCVSYRATIQLTHAFTSFLFNHSVTFVNVNFVGSFDVRPNCFTPACSYCPYTHFDSSQDIWRDDRNQPVDISLVAPQSFCDVYHDKDFMQVAEFGSLQLTHVQLADFRQQLRSLVWVDCGNVTLTDVDFLNDMAAPVGLWRTVAFDCASSQSAVLLRKRALRRGKCQVTE